MLGAVCEARFALQSLILPTAFSLLALAMVRTGYSRRPTKEQAAREGT
jgi:hypothetical protein